MVRPILKWAGGKRYISSTILDLFPPDYQQRTYHEPFLGGGAIFFRIEPPGGSINDDNTKLMDFYRTVRDHPEELIEQAGSYETDEKTYYQLRQQYNGETVSEIEKAAILLYLNKTAFNGLYRVNSQGLFNVPYGRYKNPRVVFPERLVRASELLQRIKIFSEDFTYVKKIALSGDLCYFDPPYHPLSKTARFTAYTQKGFSYTDQQRLSTLCEQLAKRQVLFIASNSDVPEITSLYEKIPDVRFHRIEVQRAISAKASSRIRVPELLITNISLD